MDQWLVFSILFCLTYQTILGQYEVRPENKYVMVGQSVTLKCSITDVDKNGYFQIWKEFYSGSASDGITVSTNDAVIKYPQVFEITGTYDLKLKANRSNLKYGGKYGCQNAVVEGQPTVYAELIVLASDPVFTETGITNPKGIVMEDDRIRYTSEITYQGRWAPIMTWTYSNGTTKQHNDDSVTGSIVHTYIEFNAQASDNGKQYTCYTSFGTSLNPAPGPGEDTTIPSYRNLTKSQTLIVHYHPRKTQIQNIDGTVITNGSELNPGDQIQCVTTSNPKSSFQWLNSIDNSELDDSDKFTIPSVLQGDVNITCVVRNAMGLNRNTTGEDSILLMVTINEIGSNGAVIGLLYVVICVVLLLVIVALIIWVIFYRGKYKPLKDENRKFRSKAVACTHQSCQTDYGNTEMKGDAEYLYRNVDHHMGINIAQEHNMPMPMTKPNRTDDHSPSADTGVLYANVDHDKDRKKKLSSKDTGDAYENVDNHKGKKKKPSSKGSTNGVYYNADHGNVQGLRPIPVQTSNDLVDGEGNPYQSLLTKNRDPENIEKIYQDME